MTTKSVVPKCQDCGDELDKETILRELLSHWYVGTCRNAWRRRALDAEARAWEFSEAYDNLASEVG